MSSVLRRIEISGRDIKARKRAAATNKKKKKQPDEPVLQYKRDRNRKYRAMADLDAAIVKRVVATHPAAAAAAAMPLR